MRVSCRWLRELCPALDASDEDIAERLTHAGLEVERVERRGEGLDGVVIAEVQKVEAHPNREQLRLVTVGYGEGRTQKVVCGAPNVPDPGGRVALATEGTVLPSLGVPLAPRKIGGIESSGMLCSESELGLAESSEGIVVLSGDVGPPGTPFTKALPFVTDTVLEIGITPNRPDALGHVGVARELAALFSVPFSPPAAEPPARESSIDLRSLVTIRNEEPERCPHYGAAIVDEVTIAPSPAWLRFRLAALGIRPISNVVDITNLLLLEFGQPMHAFDFELVEGRTIIVRRARAAEPFTTLDGVARTLDPDDLVICDAAKPSALAGVMGGENSEVRPTTRRVLLECAYFQPRGIRRTARRHGLATESSFRFERGVDWAAVPVVLERAKYLLTTLAGGAAAPGAIHARGAPLGLPEMTLRGSRLNTLLGVDVPFEEATGIVSRLGFSVEASGADVARVTGVSWRPDVTREVDLIEEVARVRGLDRIPAVLPPIAPQAPRPEDRFERRVRMEAKSLGLSEAIPYSFVSEADLAKVHAPPPVVRLENPLSEERAVMRTSLLPGLLDVLRRARRRGEREARLFSIGALFLPPKELDDHDPDRTARPRSSGDARALPEERPSFAAVLAGPRPSYLKATEEVDVYDAKGLAAELVERVTGHPLTVEPLGNACPYLHPRAAARALAGTTEIGVFGPLHPDVVDALDLDGPAVVVELDLAALERVPKAAPRYRPIPRLPAVSRDIAVLVGQDVAAADVERAIIDAAGDLCETVELFDVFEGQGIPENHRSLAYRVVYRDPNAAANPDKARTLTDKEVDDRQSRVQKAIERIGRIRA